MKRALVFFLGSLGATACDAQSWSLEAYLGNAYNFKNHLQIDQDPGYSRSLGADYRTKGFEAPLYYLLRAGRWRNDAAWELSVLHDKLYLANPPAGIASLSVSHGFNIVSVNRAARRGNWVYRVGAGPVITHAEGTINGITYDGPYRVSGAALLAGVGQRYYIGKTFLAIEGMFTAAHASPALDGPPHARLKINNVALHGLAGIGYEF